MSKKLFFLLTIWIIGCFLGCGGNNPAKPNIVVAETTDTTASPSPAVEEKSSSANIKTFEATRKDPNDKSPESSVDLCYEVTGAVRLEIQPKIGSVEPVTKGCHTFKPEKSGDYKLIATDENNISVEKIVKVEVVHARAEISEFYLEPKAVDLGGIVKVHYKVENATSAFVVDSTSGRKKLEINNKFITYKPKFPTTLTLVAYNSDGVEERQSQNLQVNPPKQAQVLKFSSRTPVIMENGAASLCYEVTYGSNFSITNSTANTVVRAAKSDGVERCVSVSPKVESEYAIEAVGSNGNPDRKTFKITVNKPAGAGRLYVGQNPNRAELCYEVKNIQSARVTTPSRLILEIPGDGTRCFPVPTDTTVTYFLNGVGKNGQSFKESNLTIYVPKILFEIRRRPTGGAVLYYEVNDFTQARILVRNSSLPVRYITNANRTGSLPIFSNYSGKDFRLQAAGNHRSIVKESQIIHVP